MTDQTMTDQAAVPEGITEEIDGDVEIEARPKGGKLTGKKIVLFIALPLLLLIGAGAGLYFSGIADSLLGHDVAEEEVAEPAPPPAVFYDLPDMLVNLNSNSRKSSYLKISVGLELTSEEDIAHLETVLPRIIDNFQVYLRELRIEDLRGSAGLQRLREELLLRVNSAVQPVVIKDVLFREMLVQ